ncbi:MAG: transglycosylase SLT domain-containing protein [Bacteroides sp.]|nr:transglycosylase SLT domain-containing protein [Bacteroides sp.]
MSCGSASGDHSDADTTNVIDSVEHHDLPDTLRVGTLYSPTSYFIYRETEMGYDYDLANRFGADKGVAIEFVIANSLSEAIAMIDSGKIDLLAYEVPITAEYLEHVVPCGSENVTHQVLVQPRKADSLYVTDVTQLVGRDIYVEHDSKYYYRLQNLNEELGGGINIRSVDRDTIITEDLIAMVSDGEIPLTVVDSDIALLNKSYYPQIDVALEISFPQRSSWAVAPDKKWLADTINQWAGQESLTRQRAQLLKRYYERSKQSGESTFAFKVDFSKGRMSPYDPLFRRHARALKWDWRLLAAMGYVESHYDSTQISWAGARGMMQLMPATARAYGLTDDQITNNDANVATAVKVLQSLDKSLSSYVRNPRERVKFILAAYNSGLAHILDAISIAGKIGTPTDVWDGSVAEALMLKSNPEYYNDPVCRYGYFRGRQTYDYVHKVMDFYDSAKKHIAL